jgi:hypothetical protein
MVVGAEQDIVKAPLDFRVENADVPVPPVWNEPKLDVMHGVMPKPGTYEYEQINGWSWGAFVFSWIWSFANGLPFWGILTLLLSPVWLNIIPAIVLGVKGREYVWKTGKFATVDKFMQVQRKWDTAALIALAVLIMLIFIIGFTSRPESVPTVR